MARFDTRELGSWEQDVAALAGSLVHEVKNPLSTLNINTQLLLEELEHATTPKEQRLAKRLRVMRDEITRIEHIVNSFLRFTERRQIDLADGDINELIAVLVERNSEALERQGIRVRFQPDPDLPLVRFSADLLHQAFLNLILNAEQAMPRGGDLMLRTRRTDGEVKVEVIDTGQGMPEERLPKIFRPYFSSKPDGTGLGLPTTLRIIREHGGNIEVESEPGRGSRFIVSLPLAQGGAK